MKRDIKVDVLMQNSIIIIVKDSDMFTSMVFNDWYFTAVSNECIFIIWTLKT